MKIIAEDSGEKKVRYHGWVGQIRYSDDRLDRKLEVWQRGKILYGRSKSLTPYHTIKWTWHLKHLHRCWLPLIPVSSSSIFKSSYRPWEVEQ